MKTDRRWYNDDRLSAECRAWSDRDLAPSDERERVLDGMANTLDWFGVSRDDCTVRCYGAPPETAVAWPRGGDRYDAPISVKYHVDAWPASYVLRVTLPDC